MAPLVKIGTLIAVAGIIPLIGSAREQQFVEGYVPRPPRTITYNKDIAPLVYKNCSTCHRPGQSGPFVLLQYGDLKKRLETLRDRVSRRAMPPWQPEPGYGEFEGDRRLSTEAIGLIQQWADEGAIEGDPRDLPAKPTWPEGWQFGKPDLVMALPEPYELKPEGRDVYVTLAVPQTLTNTYYVRAMEFHSQNRAVHHATILIDQTKLTSFSGGISSARGILGMDLPASAVTPEGHFLSWQPGRSAYVSPENAPWVLPKGAHLVLQLHLNPTGKSEFIQPEIGLFFTPQPPTQPLYKFRLESRDFEIPPGASNYVITDSYRLPVEVSVLGVNPHAHYLGKDLSGYAILPDGSRQELIRIRGWDFAWQGDYRLKRPLLLPKGTVLHMRFTYDNSRENARNPFNPPKPVAYGLQTVDEMAELWIQVTAAPKQLAVLAEDLKPTVLRKNLATYLYRLRLNPDDAGALTQLGISHLALGSTNQALADLRAAIRADASIDEPHYFLGLVYRMQGQLEAARYEFRTVVKLNPTSYKALGNLGLIAAQEGRLDEADEFFRQALSVNPSDALAQRMLTEIQNAKRTSPSSPK